MKLCECACHHSINCTDGCSQACCALHVYIIDESPCAEQTGCVALQLWYAAQLRLPRHMTKAQKKERVNTVITALGLDSCKDTIVGGFFRKGISGGERKRTSVGHELLINPSLLLLDEPTRCAIRVDESRSVEPPTASPGLGQGRLKLMGVRFGLHLFDHLEVCWCLRLSNRRTRLARL